MFAKTVPSSTAKIKVRAVFSAERDGYSAAIPAFAGCVSQGDTLAEARANLIEAAAGWWAVERERGAGRDYADTPEAWTAILADFGPSAVRAPLVEELELAL